jgi:hypothetical protein
MMTLIARLAFPPQHDESARGLIMRIAEDNLCLPSQIARWLGTPPIGGKLDCDPADVAMKIGIDSSELEAMGFFKAGSERFLGHDVPGDMLFHQRFRLCPGCLADSAYHRRIWDHKQIRICPLHKIRLIDSCPRCSDKERPVPLTWRRQHLLYCANGHDLRDTSPESVPDVTGTAAVYRFLGLPCRAPFLPKAFRKLPLQPLLDFLFFLGRMEVVVASGRVRDYCGHDMLTDPAILDAGVRLAGGWPDSFEALARAIRSRAPGGGGFRIEYDSLHRFAAASTGKPYAKLIKDAYARHLAGRPDIPTGSWPTFLPVRPKLPSALKVTQALRMLSPDGALRAGIKNDLMWNGLTKLPRGKLSPLLVKHEVLALVKRLRTLVSPRAAEGLLGLSHGRPQELCSAGLIQFTTWSGHRGRAEDRLIAISEIERKVLSQARSKPPKRSIKFTQLMQRAVRPTIASFPDVYKAILSGELRGYPGKATAPLFGSLRFEEAEVMAWIESRAGQSEKLRLGAVAERLGVETEAVHQVVAKGLLAAPGRQHGYLFDAASVAAFEARYVFDVKLPRPPRGKLATLRQQLALKGVRPVVTVKLGAGDRTTAVYRKKEIGRLVLNGE